MLFVAKIKKLDNVTLIKFSGYTCQNDSTVIIDNVTLIKFSGYTCQNDSTVIIDCQRVRYVRM